MKKKAPARKPAPKKKVLPIPAGYHSVTPYLSIKGAAHAIEFYKRAFGAREKLRMESGPGKVGHAELRIGDSIVMLADEHAEIDFLGPQSRGGTSVTLHLYVKDCDAVFNRAVEGGAKVTKPLKDEFYGDRIGTVTDPYGHVWHIATHKEDLTSKQIRDRLMAQKPG